jgi:hypothetical protein
MARAIRSCPIREIAGAKEGTCTSGKVFIPDATQAAQFGATIQCTTAAKAAHITTSPTTYATTYPANATADGSITAGVNAALAAVNSMANKVNAIEAVLEAISAMATS